MNKMCGFGDVHFSAINQWNINAGNNFLNWFEHHDFGPKEETESIWAGDIAERDVNPGVVVKQVNRLFDLCEKKFKHTYIVVGNHDKKLYHDRLQHTLMFLEDKKGFTVINSPSEIVSENGFSILGMPHLHSTETGSLSLNDFYNSYLKSLQTKEWDICCGHWNIEEGDGHGYTSDGVDISTIEDRVHCWMLGHIHIRTRKEYLGSIWPNKYDEQETQNPRCYKEYYQDKTEKEVLLPEFLHYANIKMGDAIPEEKENCEYVYCITNCSSEILAKEKYPNINIRAIERKEQVDFSELSSEENFDAFTLSYSEAFTKMRNELKVPLSRGAATIIRGLLEKKDNKN